MKPTLRHVPGLPGIAYDELGTGPPVALLHGIGGNRTNWLDQLPALAGAGYRALAWDARGYGASDDYVGQLKFRHFADDLLRLLDHAGIARAHLVGLSMGGRIAQDLYARHPDRVATLCLCATSSAFDEALSPEARAEFVRLRKQPLLEGRTPREMAPAVARTLIGPKAGPDAFERLVESMAALHPESYIKTIEASTLTDSVVDVAEIGVPTLLVFGADDTLRPVSVGERMHARLPDSELAVVPDAGHLVNIEQPEEFNRLLLEFLARHRNAAR